MPIQALEIAKSALIAHRAAMAVSGKNVANASTAGYVRRRADLSVISGNGLAGSEAGGIAGGVALTGVQRLQDDLLAEQINAQTARKASAEAQSNALGAIDTMFGDSGNGGISSALGEMFDSFNALASTPTLPSAREDVVAKCTALADAITGRATDLVKAQQEIDAQLSDTITTINDLASEVAECNKALGGVDNTSAAADILDQRDTAVTRLAELCGAVGIPQANGTMDLVIGGARLVQGDHAEPLTLVTDATRPDLHQVALRGQTNPAGLSGTVGGMLQARDGNISAYLDQLNTLTTSLQSVVNVQHTAGFDLQGNAGVALFTCTPGSPALTLKLQPSIAADPRLLAASSSATINADGSNAVALQDLRNAKALSGGVQTLEQFSADLVTHVGRDAANAMDAADKRGQLLTSMNERYQGETGVSLDDEAIDVMQYQRAYQAAAQIVNVSLEMVDSVLAIGR
jgi:flagellar hook-associated protein 1